MNWKKLAIGLAKVSASVAILAFLFVQAQQNAVFEDLLYRPKDWGLLAAAAGLSFVAVSITIVRWYLLVRALELPLTIRDSLRMGFLSYLFNLAPMGIVGGDLLKAVMLSRHQKGQRARSLATVVVDRVIGLYVLFVVASVAILLTGLWQSPVAEVRLACRAALMLTVIGTILVPTPVLPDYSNGRLTAWVGRWPLVGPGVERMILELRMYEKRRPTLVVAALMTVLVHVFFAVSVYLIARGLYGEVLPLAMQFVAVPLSAVTQVIPINIGPFEAVLDRFYAVIPLADGSHMTPGQGLVVALGYRIITLLIAAVGFCFWLVSRKEVAEAMHEVEEDSEDLVEPPPVLAETL